MGFRLLPDSPEAGWPAYAWLIYLVLFAAPAFVPSASTSLRVQVAFGVVVFLPLYFWGYWLQGRRALWPITGIALLGLLLGAKNPFASVFYIYAAAFSARVGRPAVGVRVILVLLVVLGVQSVALGLSPQFWIPGAVFTVIIGGVNIHYMESQRNRERLRLSQEEVARMAKIAERERIARDLHDLLGHTLSLLAIKAELAVRLTDRDPPKAAAEMREVERIARDALKEVRSAVSGYRSGSLIKEAEHARKALAASGIDFDFEGGPLELEPVQEGVLALALREAVTNVMRHSRARRCRVLLEQRGDQIRLEVEDDGLGVEAPEGAGLAGMRERVMSLGGRLERIVEDGTRLVISMPAAGLPRAEGASS